MKIVLKWQSYLRRIIQVVKLINMGYKVEEMEKKGVLIMKIKKLQ